MCNQSFDASRLACRLFCCCENGTLPMWNFDAVGNFNHVQNNIFVCYYWVLDLSSRGICSNGLP